MTTARNSRRSSAVRALTLALVTVAIVAASAHRRDEYLQAARVAIDPDRVQIELDLTPGVSVAEQVFSEIDGNRSGAISGGEAQAYAARVLAAIAVDMDGTALGLDLVDSRMPPRDAVLNGEGTVRIRAVAAMPRDADGVHRLRFRNTHRADISVYLANALVPVSERIAITAMERDVDQRDLVVDYVVRPAAATRTRGWRSAASVAGGMIAVVFAHLVRRPRTTRRR